MDMGFTTKSTADIACYSLESQNVGQQWTNLNAITWGELSKAGTCPNCAKAIGKGESVVRGPGVFCSLKCVAEYHQAEFSERDG